MGVYLDNSKSVNLEIRYFYNPVRSWLSSPYSQVGQNLLSQISVQKSNFMD